MQKLNNIRRYKFVSNNIFFIILLSLLFIQNLFAFLTNSLQYGLYIVFLFSLLTITNKIVIGVKEKLLIIIIFYTMIGVINSHNPSFALSQLIRLIFMFVVSLLVSNLSASNKNSIVKMYWLFAIFSSISVLIQIIFPVQFNGFLFKFVSDDYKEMIRIFDNWKIFSGIVVVDNYSAFLSSFLLAITLISLMIREKKYNNVIIYPKYISSFLIIIAFIALLASAKRGIIVATIVSISFVFMIYLKYYIGRNKEKLKIVFIIFITFLLLIIVIYILYIKTSLLQVIIYKTSRSDISTGRFELYRKILDATSSQNIIFGNGLGNLSNTIGTSSHNIYLQLLYEQGLLGLFLYIIFFLNNILLTIKRIRITKRILPFYSLMVQVLFLIYGMTGNPLYNIFFMFNYFIFISLL